MGQFRASLGNRRAQAGAFGAHDDGDFLCIGDSIRELAAAAAIQTDRMVASFAQQFEGAGNIDDPGLSHSLDGPHGGLGNDACDWRGVAGLQHQAVEAEGGG